MEGLGYKLATEGIPAEAGGAGQAAQQQGTAAQTYSLEQVVEFIKQGKDVDALLEMGIPPEVIAQAIEYLKRLIADEQKVGPQESGLAAKLAREPDMSSNSGM